MLYGNTIISLNFFCAKLSIQGYIFRIAGKSYGKDVEWCDSKGEEISVWQSMLDRPNYWIEATLLLRPNMNSRKAAA